MKKLVFFSSLILSIIPISSAYAVCEADVEKSLVHISISYQYDDGEIEPIGVGTGFLVSPTGDVLTAKHLIPPKANTPTDATLLIQGRIGHHENPQVYKLGIVPAPQSDSDAILLSFRKDVPILGDYLEVNQKFSGFKIGHELFGWGFPLGEQRTGVSAVISSLGSWLGTVQVDSAFAPGMSGGPVLDVRSNDCRVIGLIAGGAPNEGLERFKFIVPANFFAPLLSVVNASPKHPVFVSRVLLPNDGSGDFVLDIEIGNRTGKEVDINQFRLDFHSKLGCGGLAAIRKISAVYKVSGNPARAASKSDASLQVEGDANTYAAYAWYPSPSSECFIVIGDLFQFVEPNSKDRFQISLSMADIPSEIHDYLDLSLRYEQNEQQNQVSKRISLE